VTEEHSDSIIESDFVIIGSGFGGSVAALRLVQKGYKVILVEQGKRWDESQFPKSNWDSKNYYWYPSLKLKGLFNMTLLKHVLVIRGVGVGGGSLIYGNTLYTPPDSFFKKPIIQYVAKDDELKEYYKLASLMMGVTSNPGLFSGDIALKNTAEKYYRNPHFMASPNGIYFGSSAKINPDPYFSGEGPMRSGCRFCGGCYIGCRYNAKNTLDKNYLYFSEKMGLEILEQTKVVAIKPQSSDGASGYLLELQTPSSGKQLIKTKGIVLAGGVIGTLELLLHCVEKKYLPNLSNKVGKYVRTNNENVVGVRARKPGANFHQGTAASSSIFLNEHTQIQLNRYPEGSDAIANLTTLMVDGETRFGRILRLLGRIITSPADFIRTLKPKGFAKDTMLLVVMQSLESSISIKWGRRWFWPFKKVLISYTEKEPKVPAFIPLANQFARQLAKEIDGIPLNSLPEIFLNIPTTSHIIGGCVIAKSSEEGVVNRKQEVFGYHNFYICDASVIPINLGVNPSLSILALAEHAMSHIPNKSNHSFQHLQAECDWELTHLVDKSDFR